MTNALAMIMIMNIIAMLDLIGWCWKQNAPRRQVHRRVSLTTFTEAVAVLEVGFIKFGSQVVTP